MTSKSVATWQPEGAVAAGIRFWHDVLDLLASQKQILHNDSQLSPGSSVQGQAFATCRLCSEQPCMGTETNSSTGTVEFFLKLAAMYHTRQLHTFTAYPQNLELVL